MTSSVERNRAEAAAWVARMDSGVWSDADEAELQTWLAGDPLRPGALLQCQAAWVSLDKPAPARARPNPGRSIRAAILAGAVAASLAAVGVYRLTASDNYRTETGEIRRVPLADGSVAAINTASRLAFKVADGRRNARLEQGEAWFQVAKDLAHPFVVSAGRVRVRAVGTAFSVRRKATGAEVLVNEGVVEVWANGAEGHRIRLGAGQGAFVADDAAITRVAVDAASVDRALAWRSGKIELANKPLGEAIAEFNRYNRQQIVLSDPALADERLDGVFRIDDPGGFSTAVAQALSVPVETESAARIRIGRRDG